MANLTTKELTALEDQIGVEKMLVKKYRAMADLCTDTKLQQCLNNFAQKHQQHSDMLMTFLN